MPGGASGPSSSHARTPRDATFSRKSMRAASTTPTGSSSRRSITPSAPRRGAGSRSSGWWPTSRRAARTPCASRPSPTSSPSWRAKRAATTSSWSCRTAPSAGCTTSCSPPSEPARSFLPPLIAEKRRVALREQSNELLPEVVGGTRSHGGETRLEGLAAALDLLAQAGGEVAVLAALDDGGLVVEQELPHQQVGEPAGGRPPPAPPPPPGPRPPRASPRPPPGFPGRPHPPPPRGGAG